MTGPRPYPDWRPDPVERWRDAFHTFGHLLFTHTLNSVIAELPQSTTPEARVVATKAASDALYNVMMILEGIVGTPADEAHTLEFALIARVLRSSSPHDCVEQFELAPNGEESACRGFHLWSEGNFLD